MKKSEEKKHYRVIDDETAIKRAKISYLKIVAAGMSAILEPMVTSDAVKKAIKIAVDVSNQSMTVFFDTDHVKNVSGEDTMLTLIGIGIELRERYAVQTEPMITGSLVGVTVVVNSECADILAKSGEGLNE